MEKNRPCDPSAVQALIDREGTREQRLRWLEHVIQCPDCRQQLREAIDLTRFVENRLGFLEAPLPLATESGGKSQTPSLDIDEAWKRFQKRVQDEPAGIAGMAVADRPSRIPGPSAQVQTVVTEPMIMRQAFSQEPPVETDPSRWRAAKKRRKWIGAAVSAAAVAVLVVGAQAPWAGKAWAAMLQTFRIEHLVVLQPNDFTQLQNALEQAGVTHIDLKQYGQLDRKGGGTYQDVSFAEAQKLAGYPLKALPGTSPSDQVHVQGAQDITLRPHVATINDLIHRLGGKSSLPAELEGQAIVIHFPAVVSQSLKPGQGTIFFTQIQSPRIDIPQGVNMEEVRQVLLDLPILPQDMRQRLSQSEDWKNTLFVPSGPGSAENTTVNGHEAVLVRDTIGKVRSILWYNNGVLYNLGGTAADFPTDASLIQMAEAIDR
ncbi:hypothetical protein [Kyrpidia spormannii]|uniref:Zinc-finger domain-containing protein n=1 Tax=Kyrpidia spormannii TaxID=2055160 RepID=A0A6F9E5D2_9BACL|nr:hypothetical protein [Kyrpidia spormannii]CAB3391612.1 conserved protein of unknown function [Kyrpidia spormannii]